MVQWSSITCVLIVQKERTDHNNMREVRKKSVIPIYGFAAVWVLYSLIFPLFRTWHFIVLACVSALCYVLLSKAFPGTTEYVEIPEEPKQTGDAAVDALLQEGRTTVAQMRELKGAISDSGVQKKLTELIEVTEKIFHWLYTHPGDFKTVRRFADYYLPETAKLLKTYEKFSNSSVRGENITSAMDRIDSALDSVVASYKKLYDSLYYHQALDIEADIKVLESMLKQEGFMNEDFK